LKNLSRALAVRRRGASWMGELQRSHYDQLELSPRFGAAGSEKGSRVAGTLQ
jgi:hypothetical protein